HHDGESFVRVDPGSGLGLLADASTSRFAQPVPRDELPPAVADRFEDAPLLTVTRTTRMSTVQRRERMQYLGLTRRDDEGRIIGERRILGLFTRKGLAEPVHTTPVLRAKLREILRREDLVDGSYDEIELTSLFQALPKDEAFAATTDQLHALLLELQQAAAAADVRTLLRVDPHTRLASVVVTVPRERYSPQLRRRIEALLHETFDAERITVEVSLGDRPNALARFLVHLRHATHDVSATDLERRIRALTRTWADHVDAQLGDDNEHLRRLAARMPTAYRESTEPDAAIGDLLLLAALDDGGDDLRVELRTTTATPALRVRVAKRGEAVELSGFIPILESLGLSVLEEVPHRVADGDDVRYLHDFGIRAIGIDPADDSARVADAIIACWHGRLAIDGLNAVVVTAGLDWHAVRMIRAYRRLRRQLGTTFTSEYVNRTFVNQPAVARALVDCFHARFDPARDDAAASAAYARAVEVCNGLDRLDDDRILRGTLELIHATVRTNAFRDDAVDDRGVPYLSLKLDPSRLDVHDASPAFREIFVHAPDVEGVHLRYGPVARGGLRWSDRIYDVRNEVVDLAQAHVPKNAIIVPT
ncbi:MAG: NAD-glutamate dehydrogenase domain-containing protein, partial [Nitriliruptoraceae bacterium]